MLVRGETQVTHVGTALVSRCIVIDLPDVVEQWEDTEHIPLAELIRCERCAVLVGTHPACAVDYSEWPGGPHSPGGLYGTLDIHRGSLLCYKCFGDCPSHAPDNDPGDTACGGDTRVGGLPWCGMWVSPTSARSRLNANHDANHHLL